MADGGRLPLRCMLRTWLSANVKLSDETRTVLLRGTMGRLRVLAPTCC